MQPSNFVPIFPKTLEQSRFGKDQEKARETPEGKQVHLNSRWKNSFEPRATNPHEKTQAIIFIPLKCLPMEFTSNKLQKSEN